MNKQIIRVEDGLRMVNYNGEVRVEDWACKTCGEWLHHSDRSLPLTDYALDNVLNEYCDILKVATRAAIEEEKRARIAQNHASFNKAKGE